MMAPPGRRHRPGADLVARATDVPEFWDSLRSGRVGIAPIQGFDDLPLTARNVAQVRLRPARHLGGRVTSGWTGSRSSPSPRRWRRSFRRAGVGRRAAGAERRGDRLGRRGAAGHRQRLRGAVPRGRSRVHPLSVPRIMMNAGASQVATEFGIVGPTYTVSTACAAANHAIGQAFWMVRQGLVDLALTGGSEAPFSYGYLKAWEAAQALDPETCRPFSATARVPSSPRAPAMLVLESLERALEPRRHHPRRDRRVRDVGGRLPRHPALRRRGGPRHARRARRRRHRAGPDRLRQRPRHGHAG
jgi:nodulation protein E